jgi:uncharacterized membrane protein YfcA
MSRLLAQRISDLESVDGIAAAGAPAAAVLTAYLHAERMRVFRRVLWRRLALLALLWTAGAMASSIISGSGLLVGLGVLVGGGAAALWLERRAVWTLQSRLSAPAFDRPR